MPGALVGLGADDPEVAQRGVVVLADLLDGLHQHRQAGDREEVQLRRDEHAVGGDERVHRQRRHPGRAVDEHQVEALVDVEALEAALEPLARAAADRPRRARARRDASALLAGTSHVPQRVSCTTALQRRRRRRTPRASAAGSPSGPAACRTRGRRAPPARTADRGRPAARARRARRARTRGPWSATSCPRRPCG